MCELVGGISASEVCPCHVLACVDQSVLLKMSPPHPPLTHPLRKVTMRALPADGPTFAAGVLWGCETLPLWLLCDLWCVCRHLLHVHHRLPVHAEDLRDTAPRRAGKGLPILLLHGSHHLHSCAGSGLWRILSPPPPTCVPQLWLILSPPSTHLPVYHSCDWFSLHPHLPVYHNCDWFSLHPHLPVYHNCDWFSLHPPHTYLCTTTVTDSLSTPHTPTCVPQLWLILSPPPTHLPVYHNCDWFSLHPPHTYLCTTTSFSLLLRFFVVINHDFMTMPLK